MSERTLYEVTDDIKDINTVLVSREEWNRRAQPAQAGQVPMTDEQIEHALRSEPMVDNEESFVRGIRAAERHHGIVGEKGGA